MAQQKAVYNHQERKDINEGKRAEAGPPALWLEKWDSLLSGLLNNTVSSWLGDKKGCQRGTSEHPYVVIS